MLFETEICIEKIKVLFTKERKVEIDKDCLLKTVFVEIDTLMRVENSLELTLSLICSIWAVSGSLMPG